MIEVLHNDAGATQVALSDEDAFIRDAEKAAEVRPAITVTMRKVGAAVLLAYGDLAEENDAERMDAAACQR